jgi:hypothetical protein
METIVISEHFNLAIILVVWVHFRISPVAIVQPSLFAKCGTFAT